MSFISSLRIAGSALKAQRQRMNTVTSNLANAETTRTEQGGPYKRRDPIFETKSTGFEAAMVGAQTGAQGVEVTRIVEDHRDPRQVYDPDHPDADENGYVAMPNVSVVQEMVDMISAARSYEAATSAIATTKQMANAALEIGS